MNSKEKPWWGYHVEEVLERESHDDVHGFYAVCENCSREVVAKFSVELHPNAERAAIRESKRLNKQELRERRKLRKIRISHTKNGTKSAKTPL